MPSEASRALAARGCKVVVLSEDEPEAQTLWSLLGLAVCCLGGFYNKDPAICYSGFLYLLGSVSFELSHVVVYFDSQF